MTVEEINEMDRDALVHELEKRGHICFFFHKEEMMRRVLKDLVREEERASPDA